MLVSLKLHQIGVEVKLFGGYEHAERQMAAFFPGGLGFSWDYPIDCLKIEPKALRFSEELGHRDYLGALLNLGVDRSVVGDILIKDKEAWFFCLHKMSDFFIENLIRVKHTTVLVSRVEQAEEIPEPEFEMTNGTCASVRLDALIGLAFQTSRSSMVSFIESGLVFVNGKLITSNGYEPKEGDIISVRGKGRFIYDGVSRQTKKRTPWCPHSKIRINNNTFGEDLTMAEEKLLVKRDGEFCYPIYFENDFSFLSQALTDEGLAGKSMCIVSDSTVAPLYADQVKAELLKVSDHVYQFTFPAGEAYKNLDTVQDLFQCLIENGLDRKSLVVALGGGVTGDLSGFGAAAYLRGIDFIQIPTTLLAQVDSSVGGKTGVDFRQFKNMVGAFHQPRLVYMNMATLQSLPEREFGCGMGEILKTGLI